MNLPVRPAIAAGILVSALALLALIVRDPATEPRVQPAVAAPPPGAPAETHPGFIYGRVAVDGQTYEGRLRWGGDQEAFWTDYFDGVKPESPWADHAPGAARGFEIFGFEIGGNRSNLRRQFMTRFGDLARIEAHVRRVHVTLKSGTVFELDRFSAGDIDDGVRVWDVRHGVVDIGTREIRTIEFLPTAALAAAPGRLHGTVRTRLGDFSGFIQWDWQDGAGDDELEGRAAGDERRLRYDTIRSIARHSRDGALVTLLDGREMVLSDHREVGPDNRGIYVDDRRYGRVLVSWEAFERVEFTPGGSGPAYSDFAPGWPLAGSVTTRDGRRLVGRLVYDFDESETTETFDVSDDGIEYKIPFGLIASIVPRPRNRDDRRASVTLHDGEALNFERNGDLSERNAGVLIFVNDEQRPEYLPWNVVDRIDLEAP